MTFLEQCVKLSASAVHSATTPERTDGHIPDSTTDQSLQCGSSVSVNYIPARHMLYHTRQNLQHGARLLADSGTHHALASILNRICYSLHLVTNADKRNKKRPSILINKYPQSFGKRTHNTAFDVYGKVHK